MSYDDAIEGRMEQEEEHPNYHTHGWGETRNANVILQQLLHAASIAARHHDDHPFQVALRSEPEDIIVALLHDCLEDGYAELEELNMLFSAMTVAEVIILTRRDEEKYFDYIDRVKEAGGQAAKVKLTDAQINYDRCKKNNHSLIKRYEKVLSILKDG